MTANPRAVVVGYLVLPAYTDPETAERLVKAWRDSFAAQAFREGYALGPVFTDVRDRGEGGLYRLTEYLRRDDVIGVMVPDLGHLTQARGLAGADRRTVQRFLQAAVLPVASGANGGCDGRR